MKLNKVNPNYIFAGVILLTGIAYGTYNYAKIGSFFPPKQSTQQEEVIEEDTTPVIEEEKTEPTTPTQIHIACATNDWDCFAKAAKDKNTATLISFLEDFPDLISGAMDLTTEFKITNIANNGDVTLSEKKTKVVIKTIEYTEEQLKSMGEAWSIDDKEAILEEIELNRQKSDDYWQEQVGLVRISVFTLESFLVFTDQWKNTHWSASGSWSGIDSLGQPYKVIKDEYLDQREPPDWMSDFE